MVALSAGVTKLAPVFTTVVKAASLYQVNTGLVTVVLVAVKVTVEPPQMVLVPVKLISVGPATGLTVTVTSFALPGLFAHLFVPLTVT
ncbi:hypothetical protein D3C87_1346990 [compost metagenome]